MLFEKYDLKMSTHSVWVKVGLYMFDVGSYWVNGGLMLQCPVNSTLNDTITTRNATTSCDTWWGALTIAMSWNPPTLVLLTYVHYVWD